MTEQPRPLAATAAPADAQSDGDGEQTIVIIGPDGQPIGLRAGVRAQRRARCGRRVR